MIEMISLLGGGLLRLVPEFLSLVNKGKDNKHELDMLEKQFQLEQTRNKQQFEQVQYQGETDISLALLKAQEAAVTSQMQLTKIKWVDAMNFSVRPVYALSALALYYVSKALLFISAGWNLEALSKCYTAEDFAFLMGITSFYFVGRVIDKRKT